MISCNSWYHACSEILSYNRVTHICWMEIPLYVHIYIYIYVCVCVCVCVRVCIYIYIYIYIYIFNYKTVLVFNKKKLFLLKLVFSLIQDFLSFSKKSDLWKVENDSWIANLESLIGTLIYIQVTSQATGQLKT